MLDDIDKTIQLAYISRGGDFATQVLLATGLFYTYWVQHLMTQRLCVCKYLQLIAPIG
jgi:hypothetical protein